MIKKHWLSLLYIVLLVLIVIASIMKSLSIFEILQGLFYLTAAYLCAFISLRKVKHNKQT